MTQNLILFDIDQRGVAKITFNRPDAHNAFDGEFVSRADAVLGAGILSGANPKNFKVMREKGAEFFYDQQKKLKRVYDLLNESKTN